MSGTRHQLAFVKEYAPSGTSMHVDEFSYDDRFCLPKIVPIKKYKIIPVAKIVRPVRLIPDFEKENQGVKEYFVRFILESSTKIDQLLED